MATPILVTGAAGRVGGVGRTITGLLLKQGKAVRAMVRNEDQRAHALRDMGAEVVVGDLLDLDSMHRAIAGCEAMYFGMSGSDTYLAATVNAAAVAKHHDVEAFINMSQMTLAQMSITETTRVRFGCGGDGAAAPTTGVPNGSAIALESASHGAGVGETCHRRRIS
jgi:uncharacterized protein YbjT (DUF2867 family)